MLCVATSIFHFWRMSCFMKSVMVHDLSCGRQSNPSTSWNNLCHRLVHNKYTFCYERRYLRDGDGAFLISITSTPKLHYTTMHIWILNICGPAVVCGVLYVFIFIVHDMKK